MKRGVKVTLILIAVLFVMACQSTPDTNSSLRSKEEAEAKYAELVRKQEELKKRYNEQHHTDDGASQVKLGEKNIEQNVHFKRSMELRSLSQELLTSGDYDKAYNYAVEGLRELEKFESINALMLAEQRMNTAKQRGLHTQNSELYAQIVDEVDKAKGLIERESYRLSKNHSDKALSLLDELMKNSASGETYTVVKGDSMWKIAGRPSIYADPFAWPRIYMANKHRLRYPDNPDLIHPGQVFDIPR